MSPEPLVAVTLAGVLSLYVLTGGADFGGGVWDLLASGPNRGDQRRAIADAIGPIWEANHVWLILAIVITFVAFPAAFAAISIALHVPLTVLLFGIVLRGTAFVFRAYDWQRDERGEPGAAGRGRRRRHVGAPPRRRRTGGRRVLRVVGGAVPVGGGGR